MIRMPKMPQPRKQPGATLPDDLLAATEATDTPERRAAARKYLDADRTARTVRPAAPLRRDDDPDLEAAD